MRRFIWLPLILCTAMLAVVRGQELTITVPEKAQPYTLIDATATTGFSSYLWKVKCPDGLRSQQIRKTGPLGNMICFTGPPGVYQLEVLCLTGECPQQQIVEALATTTIGGSQPDPPPPPPSKLMAVVIVEESEDRTTDTAAVINSLTWRKYLDGLGIPYRVADPNAIDPEGNVPSHLASSLRAAAATQGPDVCFVGVDGSAVCEPLPESIEAMVALLKQWGR